MKDLVSIITPVFNGEHTIESTIKSVLNQSYENWELIIVNDGSKDSTLKIAKKYSCDKIIVIDSENCGVSNARNLAVSFSRGKYLVPLDADNTLESDFLISCIKKFEIDSNLRLVYTEANLFGDDSGLWNLPKYNYKTMLHFNMIDNCAMFFKDDFNRVGGYRLNMINGLEDWDFWIALLSVYEDNQVCKIDLPLFNYRVSKSSRRMTLLKSRKFDSMLQNIVLNNFEVYNSHFPEIHNRIISYDYHRNVLKKWPVRILVSAMNTFHNLKLKIIN
ncbi:MAG: glycosyltransferase [Flavobacteriia bacterium]|jgi:glycosyltransferase involved in cell wall biosynthesis